MIPSVPDFDDLPKVEGMPQGCAWGVFDRDGKKDTYGTLNFLSAEVVKAAASEVKDGVSISLNWPLNGFAKIPIPGRRQPKHTFLSFAEKAAEEGSDIDHAWDDELEINTQSSSQWDSFCHYAHQHTGRNYNGAKATREKLSADPTENDRLPTLENWHSRGCVVGRGVLLDFKAYAEAVGKEYEPFGSSYITAEELDACAVHQGVEFHPGDVLLIRTGQTEFVEDSSAEELGKALVKGHFSGLNGAEETARWLWNKRFAAVASDSLALEAYPPRGPDGKSNPAGNLILHEYMLSCFGMPIGELWDLRRLAEYCQKAKRYSFMITSAPLNLPHLIGSPPNALAIL